jgi:hypothetical protein
MRNGTHEAAQLRQTQGTAPNRVGRLPRLTLLLVWLVACWFASVLLANAAPVASNPFDADFRDYVLTVTSDHGNPTPPVGTTNCAWGATVTCSVESAVSQSGTNWVCVGWTGTGSVPSTGGTASTGPILLTSLSSSITWQWDAESIDAFTYTTNNGTITITGYTGSGGVVTIPDLIDGLPVTSIGERAFQFCNTLKQVVILGNLTNIGAGAFVGCSSLVSITLGGNVTRIGDGAFAGCFELTCVAIGSRVTSIGTAPFESCTNLTEIAVDEGNTVYSSSVDGVLFDKSKTSLIQCPGGKAGDYTVPSSVNTILDSAFSGCLALTNVSIPDSVTDIRDFTFAGCRGLTSITIPNSVIRIGNGTFSKCASIASVTIGNGVTSVGGYAFECSYALTNLTIGTNVSNIGDYAFTDCSSLTSITIPARVSHVGYRAFSDCRSLTAITVDDQNSFYSSLGGVLFNKSKTTLVQCPGGKAGSVTIPDGVNEIGNFAFYLCQDLTNVMISSSVTSIGRYTFTGCSSLTNITIPVSVTSLGSGAFHYCTSLTVMVLPGIACDLSLG